MDGLSDRGSIPLRSIEKRLRSRIAVFFYTQIRIGNIELVYRIYHIYQLDM